jgi:hypothetical protein
MAVQLMEERRHELTLAMRRRAVVSWVVMK